MRAWLSSWTALFALFAAFGAVPAANAQDFVTGNAMSRDEIFAAFVDQQLSGVYPSGAPWSELIRPDGTSDYREGGNRREGRWWMRGNDFCFRYDPPLSGGCFRVVRIGANCYELYSVSRGGDAVPGPQSGAAWNGRMWRDDAAPTCEERPTS
ncbi:MAG: hypothetical protein ACK4TL_07640 [Hyphomicrobiaceae bacterium]